ncbi:MAG: YceI family protein [Flavobacteriaceae bacterium]|nr:YceI family protein [Flavobacteriaceae bacterium]
MKLQSLLILFFSCVVSSNAQQLVQNKAEVDFKIKNIGMYVDGKFNDVAINSNFNSENLNESYINTTIKVNSINTKNTKRDKHLLSDDYFDAASYEDIKLKTTKIEKVSENKYKLIAKLTIKETTKRIVIPLQVNENEESITIRSNFNINRRDYKVGGSSWILSNTVKIEIVYIAKK